MLTLIASATLTFAAPLPVQDAEKTEAAPKADAKKELVELTGALGKAESYSFTVETPGSAFGGRGNFGGGRGGGRGGDRGGRGGEQAETPEPAAPVITAGTFQKGMPLHLSQGEVSVYKDGDQMVYKAEDKWKLFDTENMRSAFGGGRGGGRGRGGDQGGGGGGEADREAMRAQMEALRPVMAMQRTNAPHTMLEGFGEKVDTAKKTEKEGTITYKGDLTEEGAEALMTSGRGARGFGGGRGGGRGGDGGDGPQMEYEGTYTIVVKDGAIAKVTYEATMFGVFGDREFERTTEGNVTISEVGKAKHEVPEDALAQFEI